MKRTSLPLPGRFDQAGVKRRWLKYVAATSSRAMRSAKKARVEEEKGQEEEMEQQEERDEEDEEDRKPRFPGEDIRDYSGEVERHQVFAAAFAELLPPQKGGTPLQLLEAET